MMLAFDKKRNQYRKVVDSKTVKGVLAMMKGKDFDICDKPSVADMVYGAEKFAKNGNYAGAYNLLKIAVGHCK